MAKKSPTIKQRRVAEKIVENTTLTEPLTGGEILEKVGYGPGMVKNPQMVLRSDGVKEALGDLGFSEEGAMSVVAQILYDESAKHHDRLDAADKVFKVHGSYAPDKHMNVNVEVEASPKVKELADKLNALYRGRSESSDGTQPGTLDDKASNQERDGEAH